MSFIRNFFDKTTNRIVAHQDYGLIRGFMEADFSFAVTDIDQNGDSDSDKIAKKLFHLEGIFLDLTDRTQAHPTVPFSHDDRGGMFSNIIKDLGLGNRRVIWKPSDLFNLDDYFAANWFPDSLAMHLKEFNEMLNAKDLYSERRISFLEYFFKRLDIYKACQMPTFLKYYEGVDLEKYKDKIRKISADFPHLNKKGEVV